MVKFRDLFRRNVAVPEAVKPQEREIEQVPLLDTSEKFRIDCAPIFERVKGIPKPFDAVPENLRPHIVKVAAIKFPDFMREDQATREGLVDDTAFHWILRRESVDAACKGAGLKKLSDLQTVKPDENSSILAFTESGSILALGLPNKDGFRDYAADQMYPGHRKSGGGVRMRLQSDVKPEARILGSRDDASGNDYTSSRVVSAYYTSQPINPKKVVSEIANSITKAADKQL